MDENENANGVAKNENSSEVFVLWSGYFFGILLTIFDTVLAAYYIYLLLTPWESDALYRGEFYNEKKVTRN
jgi:hypothetical protein